MASAFFNLASRTAAVVLLVSSVLFSAPSLASQPFDEAAFALAQKADKPILVDVTASWCPVCQMQGRIIEKLEAENPQLVVFAVDFDNSPDVLARFGVIYQSTLIVFRGPNEVARSIGDTDEDRIAAMVGEGL